MDVTTHGISNLQKQFLVKQLLTFFQCSLFHEYAGGLPGLNAGPNRGSGAGWVYGSEVRTSPRLPRIHFPLSHPLSLSLSLSLSLLLLFYTEIMWSRELGALFLFSSLSVIHRDLHWHHASAWMPGYEFLQNRHLFWSAVLRDMYFWCKP